MNKMRTMLEYLAGRCDPEVAEYLRKQLESPDSEESVLLREMQNLSQSAFHPEVVAAAGTLDLERHDDVRARTRDVSIRVYHGSDLVSELPRLEHYVTTQCDNFHLTRHPAWAVVLEEGTEYRSYTLEASKGDATCGIFPLTHVRSEHFGSLLVSLPYSTQGGSIANDVAIEDLLMSRAVELADELDVAYLEVRTTFPVRHAAFTLGPAGKVVVRQELPESTAALWAALPVKVRNQIRRAEKEGLTVSWGGIELFDDYCTVYHENMNSLGLPVLSRSFYHSVIGRFLQRTEFCILRLGDSPIAASLVLHGWGITEPGSAHTLRNYTFTSATFLLYWELMKRAVQRGQGFFDFGRCSLDSNNYRFKSQWGGQPVPANWQYYVRSMSNESWIQANDAVLLL